MMNVREGEREREREREDIIIRVCEDECTEGITTK